VYEYVDEGKWKASNPFGLKKFYFVGCWQSIGKRVTLKKQWLTNVPFDVFLAPLAPPQPPFCNCVLVHGTNWDERASDFSVAMPECHS
jgi:hypothetical protein